MSYLSQAGFPSFCLNTVLLSFTFLVNQKSVSPGSSDKFSSFWSLTFQNSCDIYVWYCRSTEHLLNVSHAYFVFSANLISPQGDFSLNHSLPSKRLSGDFCLGQDRLTRSPIKFNFRHAYTICMGHTYI